MPLVLPPPPSEKPMYIGIIQISIKIKVKEKTTSSVRKLCKSEVWCDFLLLNAQLHFKDDTLAELAVCLGNVPLEDEADHEPVVIEQGAVPHWIEGSLGNLICLILIFGL